MTLIEPNLNADIIPDVCGAGINLGISFKNFLTNTKHFLLEGDEFNKTFVEEFDTNNQWFISGGSSIDVYGQKTSVFWAKWNDDVILRFNGEEEKTLQFMILQGNYKGKLLGKWGLGTTLEELSQEYEVIFYADTHYLKEKNSKQDEVISVEIHTNYLLSFEQEANQIVKAMCLHMTS